jgi:hypothetical protein
MMRFVKSESKCVLSLLCADYHSVIALSKLYSLDDARLAQIQVKGDLMVPSDDGRIMTRSRAKLRMLKSCDTT